MRVVEQDQKQVPMSRYRHAPGVVSLVPNVRVKKTGRMNLDERAKWLLDALFGLEVNLTERNMPSHEAVA